jgi:hypothetical protein
MNVIEALVGKNYTKKMAEKGQNIIFHQICAIKANVELSG